MGTDLQLFSTCFPDAACILHENCILHDLQNCKMFTHSQLITPLWNFIDWYFPVSPIFSSILWKTGKPDEHQSFDLFQHLFTFFFVVHLHLVPEVGFKNFRGLNFQHAEKSKNNWRTFEKRCPSNLFLPKKKIKASKISKIMFFSFNRSNSNLTLHFSLPPPPQPTLATSSPRHRLDGHPHASRLMHSGLDLGDTDTLGRYTVVDSASCLGPGWCVNFEDWKLGDCWFTHPQLVRELIGVTKCLCTYVSVWTHTYYVYDMCPFVCACTDRL